MQMQTPSRPENRFLILIGLLIALGLPFSHLGGWTIAHSGLGPYWGSEAFWVPFFLLICVYVVVIERRPFSSIGFRAPRLSDIPLGIGAAILIVAGDVGISLLDRYLHLAVKPQIGALFAAPFWYRFFIVARAAIVEETAFRGYGFERIVELTGNRWLAAFLTFALFTLAHYPGGGLALALAAAWGGLVLTLLYLWRRNLWATMLPHWLTDVIGLLVIPALSAHH
ncbi:MAG TPA: CPBP family intramembrane glutamic endopeptidase [Rhizomicrobium sp.]|nr:CPBP family intramembrane glutamic endopeptidase [Rhizomicrobium sp.]